MAGWVRRNNARRHRYVWRMRASWLLCAVALVLPMAAQAQGRHPNLSGVWLLRGDSSATADTAAATPDSASARDSIAKADSAAVGQRADSRTDGSGRTVGRSVPRVTDKDRRQVGLLLGMAQPVASFTLAQSDSTLTVTNADGFTYTVYLDGRKSILPLSDSVRVEARAKWDDGALVIEYKPTGGGRMTERYRLADSRQYLRLEVSVEHGAMARPYWRPRMYRRSEEAGS